jgi:hypothetical protein
MFRRTKVMKLKTVKDCNLDDCNDGKRNPRTCLAKVSCCESQDSVYLLLGSRVCSWLFASFFPPLPSFPIRAQQRETTKCLGWGFQGPGQLHDDVTSSIVLGKLKKKNLFHDDDDGDYVCRARNVRTATNQPTNQTPLVQLPWGSIFVQSYLVSHRTKEEKKTTSPLHTSNV